MNETIKTILNRRSVRSFTDQRIGRDELELIVKAGIHAPSGRNKQLWHFSAVCNEALIQKLAHAISKELGSGDDYNFYGPNALIIVSNQRDNPHGEADSACALENIFLAAHSMGIGSVWINQLKGICDVPDIRNVLNELKVPADHVVWGMAALGYPAHPHKESKRETEGKIDFIL